jgi:aminoglycoside N3'-acetyltransferase
MSESFSSDPLKEGTPPSVGGEAGAIRAADRPATPSSLTEDLRSLGVTEGSTLLVHASLSAIGWVAQGAPMTVDGVRLWVTFEALDGEDDDFELIGAAFAESGGERSGRVGSGDALYMGVRDLVDFAVDWMTQNRVDRTDW